METYAASGSNRKGRRDEARVCQRVNTRVRKRTSAAEEAYGKEDGYQRARGMVSASGIKMGRKESASKLERI
jgi:hypothetical protein